MFMLNIDKVKLLYNKAIFLDDIRTKDIINTGLNKHDIEAFLKYNILKRVSRGHYELTHCSSLLIYSNYLLDMSKTEEAIIALKRCLKIDPINKIVYSKLIYTYIRCHKYDQALEYFKFLYQDESNRKINNIYLYLLSFLTDLPSEYKEIAFNMTKDDFDVSKVKALCNNSKLYNQAFSSIYYGKYLKAIYKLSMIKDDNKDNHLNDAIMIKLLYLVINKNKKNYKKMETLIEEKKYDELWNYLNNILLNRPLSHLEETIYSMVLHYFKMNALKEVPQKKNNQNGDDNYFLTAVLNCDYEYAYMLYQEYEASKDGAIPKNNLFLPLLEEILKEKDKIRKMDDYIKKIITNIKMSNLDETIPLMKEFLEYSNNSNHLYLVICYAKISLLKQDSEFKILETILKKLKSPYFKIELNDYINLYKDALRNGEYEISQVYLDIIRRNTDDPNLISSLSRGIDMDKKDTLYDKINPDIIKEKVGEAKVDGIALFPVMAEDELILAKKIIKEIPNMRHFTVANEFGKRIVLKYSPKKGKKFNYKGIIQKIKQEIKNKNYDEALRLNKELLEFYFVPKSHLLAQIGYFYYFSEDYSAAYKYFVVADEMFYKLNNYHNQNYLNIAHRINPLLGYENAMTLGFYDEAVNLLKSNKSMTDVMSLGHYADSDIPYIYLFYAKECYKNEDYKTGDEYLNLVEAMKSEDVNVAKLFKEISENKMHYKGRNSESLNRKIAK